MIYENRNFSRDKINTISPSPGDIFRRCNLSQINQNTIIFAGIENLHFEYCNMVNCVKPANSTIIGGLFVQIDFCGNLHPKMAPLLSNPCLENCRHVINTDEIQINGITIETIYYYEDIVS